jgi:hypothetical protein
MENHLGGALPPPVKSSKKKFDVLASKMTDFQVQFVRC